MNLYLISQDINSGYDTYDSAVVAAESEKDAREIHPSSFVTHVNNDKWMGTYPGGDCNGDEYEAGWGACGEWVEFSDIKHVTVELLGETSKDKGVVLASFNAG